MQFYMQVPEHYHDIIEITRSAGWLTHNFRIEISDIYNAVNYQHNREIDDINYKIILDMNCLQYLLNIARRSEPSELSRIAAAYLAFAQIADIQFDPTYAIYEKINYTDDLADEAISNLEQFRGIDNHSLDELIEYALGHKKRLCIKPRAVSDRGKLRNELLQYRRLTDWDSLYLCVLSITSIALDSSTPRPNKLLTFVNWCIREFRFSLAALVYAAVLFGKSPVKKMMKYKERDPHLTRQAALRNMTWNLYYIDRYMKFWTEKDQHTEILMLTADNGLRVTMQLAVECQHSGGLAPLKPYLTNELQAIETAYLNKDSAIRAYNSEKWGYEYRNNLIAKYESELLKS